MFNEKPPKLQTYFDAVLAVTIGLFINGLLSLGIGSFNPYLVFAAVVMVIAFLGGLGPGLLATSIGALSGVFFFLAPSNTLYIDRPVDILYTVVFLAVGIFISWLGDSQKRLKEALEENEDRYRDLVENNQSLICTHDLDGLILSVNEGAAKMLGYDPRTLVNKNIRDIIVPEFQNEFDAYLATIRKDGFAAGLMQVQTASGESRVWEYRNTLRTHGVRTPVVRGTAHDVTARLRAEQASREATLTLKALIRASPLAVISLSRDGLVRVWNPAAERIFGWGEQEVIGSPLPIVPDELQHEYAAYLDTVLKGRFLIGLETRSRRKDSSIIDISLSAAPVYDAKANIIGAMGIIADITEHKMTEEALREQAELLDLTHDTIMVRDVTGVITYWNRGAERMYGWTREEAVGKDAHTLLRTEFPVPFDEIQAGFIKTGWWEGELIQTRSDGTQMVVASRWVLKQSEPGRPATTLEINYDITERKHAERERERLLASERAARAEAEAASRAKDQFLATVSHELRTPLTSILGWTHILRKGKLDADKAAHGLETIERNSKAQMQLIEDLLDVSRIVSGKLRLDERPVSLLSVITAAIEVVRPAADAKRVELLMKVDASVGPMQGDPNRLQQVVWNLLSNAVKFTDEGGRVEVKLERAEQHARITVTDTGCGISPEFLPHVFDSFRQDNTSMSGRHGGLGLGLAIARQLVEMHGGTMWAESEGAGRGATFTVKLPLRRGLNRSWPPVEETRSQSGSARQGRLASHPFVEGLRVMVVDDDAETREVLLEILEQHGAEVVACSSVSEALEMLQWNKPDVLISDIAMPDEDGYSLISKLRRLQPEQGGRTPAVALTAHARAEDEQRALSAGFEVFIPKPIEAEVLLLAVAELARSAGPYH